MKKRRLASRPNRPILKFVPNEPFKGETRLLLFINGRHVSAPAINTKLLAYLHAHLGKAISFHKLCLILGHPNGTAAELHILRQYTTWVRHLLDEYHLPYRLATVIDLGYALCEPAPDGKRTKAFAKTKPRRSR